MLCAFCPPTILQDPREVTQIVREQSVQSMRVKRSDPQKDRYIFQTLSLSLSISLYPLSLALSLCFVLFLWPNTGKARPLLDFTRA